MLPPIYVQVMCREEGCSYHFSSLFHSPFLFGLELSGMPVYVYRLACMCIFCACFCFALSLFVSSFSFYSHLLSVCLPLLDVRHRYEKEG
mmetsp:Transcript_27987/g.71218  ORF Transcript_27987/g.71218 Transcript_27987/m.71218 type:complete len:90 (-) Transcript_27987:1769-2038(-)